MDIFSKETEDIFAEEIDIFESTPEEPMLYIADIRITSRYKIRSNSKDTEQTSIVATDYPVILLNGKMPSRWYEEGFMKRVASRYKMKEGVMRITDISNIRFSSKLNYKFDFDKR